MKCTTTYLIKTCNLINLKNRIIKKSGQNIDTIIKRTKEDVISETGITFLLAGKEKDPIVSKTRHHILNSIDKTKNMIPSASGDFDLAYGEHRNVLAIMLLDWHGVHSAPTIQNQQKIFSNLPYGLVSK